MFAPIAESKADVCSNEDAANTEIDIYQSWRLK
jgi:hypothetical protein